MKSMRIKSYLAIITAVFMSSACIKWFPGRVSEGVGRLSIRNVAIITKLINADEACGFAAPAVYDHPALEGNTTESGRAIWSVDQCELEFSDYVMPADCNGVVTTVSGKITVSARRELVGRLTGDVELPVIPQDETVIDEHRMSPRLAIQRLESVADRTVSSDVRLHKADAAVLFDNQEVFADFEQLSEIVSAVLPVSSAGLHVDTTQNPVVQPDKHITELRHI